MEQFRMETIRRKRENENGKERKKRNEDGINKNTIESIEIEWNRLEQNGIRDRIEWNQYESIRTERNQLK